MTRYQIKSPLYGIDTISALPEVKEGFAIQLNNYFPTTTNCSLRKGWKELYTISDEYGAPVTAPVTSIFPIPDADKVLAICDNKIYEAVNSTLLSGEFSYASYPTFQRYKDRVYIADGANPLVAYNITTGELETVSLLDGATDNIYSFVGIVNQQLILIPNDTLGFYYLPVGNVSGYLSYFDLSQVAKEGGYLMAAYSYGVNTSNGYNNYAAFITSNGEAIVYSSAYFAQAAKIQIVGAFKTGRPLGRHCGIHWGADLVLILDNGIRPMSQIVSNGDLLKKSELFSNYIQGQLMKEIAQASSSFGWAGTIIPNERFAIINTPNMNQLVMNIDTGAWCTFSGLKAYDIALGAETMLFGTDGGVIAEYSGSNDNGGFIQGTVQLPYSKFGTLEKKNLLLMRTRIKANINPSISYFIGVDFVNSKSTYSDSQAPIEGPEWADAGSPINEGVYWDEVYWGDSGVEDFNRTYSIAGLGYDLSIGFSTSTVNTEIEIYDFIIDFDPAQGAI